MTLGHRVRVGMCAGTSTLEILATHQAGVDVDPCQRDGAQLLKVKVQQRPIYGIQVWADAKFGIEGGRRLQIYTTT